MSAEALNYVDKLRQSPTGAAVTAREKAVLHILANAHNDKKRAAWLRVATIAESLNVSTRAVRMILASCMAKGIIWRIQRFEGGQQTSNFWKFSAIDGQETAKAKQASEKLVERGREGRRKSAAQKSFTFSTDIHRGDCNSLQGGTEEIFTPTLKNSSPLGLKKTSDHDPVLEPVQKPTLEPVLVPATVENSDFSDQLQLLRRKLDDRRRAMGLRHRDLHSAGEIDLGAAVVRRAL